MLLGYVGPVNNLIRLNVSENRLLDDDCMSMERRSQFQALGSQGEKNERERTRRDTASTEAGL